MRTIAIVATLCAAGCAHPPLPTSRDLRQGEPVSGLSVADVPVHGASVTIRTPTTTFQGELLAVTGRQLVILPEGSDKPGSLRMRPGDELMVEIRPSAAMEAGVLTAVGTVSTLTHGLFLIISAPIWGVAGSALAVQEAAGNDAQVHLDELDLLSQYARFPQGWPGEPLPAD